MKILFTTDLHGNEHYYNRLSEVVRMAEVDVVINGGDMLPKEGNLFAQGEFIADFLAEHFATIDEAGIRYLCYLGNDDLRVFDDVFAQTCGQYPLVTDLAQRKVKIDGYEFIGMNWVVDYPFLLAVSSDPTKKLLRQYGQNGRAHPCATSSLLIHSLRRYTGPMILRYRNLAQLRKQLKPILLRRTRGQVMKQLPERTTEIVRIPATAEQIDMHGAHMRVVSSIVRKPFISEMDLLRLQKALLMCRRSANSTCLVDKQVPGYSSKLAHLNDMLGDLAGEDDRKIVMFSE